MAWLAVDKDGSEMIFQYKPEKKEWDNYKQWIMPCFGNVMTIPSTSIHKLIGKTLTWDDEPVEIK